MKELKIYRNQSISSEIRDCKDAFLQELTGLWEQWNRCGTIYTLLEKNKLIGTVFSEEFTDRATVIRGLYVSPKYRGRGFGDYLVRLVTCEKGKYGIWVNITAGSEKVYLKNDFKLLGKRLDVPNTVIGVWGEISEEEKKAISRKVGGHCNGL